MKVILLLLIFSLSAPLAARPSIVWFSTLQEDQSDKSGFWTNVYDLIQAAAEDLDVDFKVYYARENFIRYQQQVERVLKDPETRPDGILFHNYKRQALPILKLAENFGVKSFIFNAGLIDEHADLQPRKDFKHWVGQMLPDDEFAGQVLLEVLLREARQLGSSAYYPMIAMEGNATSKAYLARKRGLERALQNNPDVQLRQYFPADWSRDKARNMFATMMKRYPLTRIVWSANDNMALGIIDAALATGAAPGKDFVVGGVDWLEPSLEAIAKGHMALSVGGHFVEGMWALVLMYDFLQGHDFAAIGPISFKTQMHVIDSSNIERFSGLGERLEYRHLRRFDFSQLSRHHNGKSQYDFSIERLIKLL